MQVVLLHLRCESRRLPFSAVQSPKSIKEAIEGIDVSSETWVTNLRGSSNPVTRGHHLMAGKQNSIVLPPTCDPSWRSHNLTTFLEARPQMSLPACLRVTFDVTSMRLLCLTSDSFPRAGARTNNKLWNGWKRNQTALKSSPTFS